MIFTDRIIMVQKGTSSINDTIVLYRGDKEVEIRFTLNEGSPFKFGSGASPNIIEKTEAAYGQLIIKTPNDLPAVFSEIAPTNNGKIVFTITAEMIDEITEVGYYTFQIRLFDENQESRATIPEVIDGIEIREPIASEDGTNEVGVATVGYAMTTAGTTEDAFDSQGNYNKTTWVAGDRITAAKLNKIEAGIDGVNKKVASGGSSGEVDLNDTTASTTTTYSSNKIENIKEDLSSRIKETKAEVDVERKRIDSFTSLGEGSTTGDAELVDGRIGADGVTYDNIGGAIRGQYTSLDTKKVTGVGITKIMTITQEDYDFSIKDPNTLYIISDTTGEEGGGGSHPLIPYLKNTGGNSYIDTGYVPKLNSKFEFTVRDTSLVTNNRYFGNQMFDMYYAGTNYIGATHGNNYAGARITNINSKHTCVRNSTEFYVDGQLQATVEAGTRVDNRTLYIFGRHLADGYSTTSSEFIFFELKIYENDTLVHHYKPRKDSSDVACLYDIVTQQYLYNSGTGTLEYGTELEEV